MLRFIEKRKVVPALLFGGLVCLLCSLFVYTRGKNESGSYDRMAAPVCNVNIYFGREEWAAGEMLPESADIVLSDVAPDGVPEMQTPAEMAAVLPVSGVVQGAAGEMPEPETGMLAETERGRADTAVAEKMPETQSAEGDVPKYSITAEKPIQPETAGEETEVEGRRDLPWGSILWALGLCAVLGAAALWTGSHFLPLYCYEDKEVYVLLGWVYVWKKEIGYGTKISEKTLDLGESGRYRLALKKFMLKEQDAEFLQVEIRGQKLRFPLEEYVDFAL